MTPAFEFSGSETSSSKVTFSDVQRPHHDELTFFGVTVIGDGLRASCSVESLQGDHGFLEHTWRSLGGELLVRLGVDDLGHTDVLFEISPTRSKRTWSATSILQYNLGDLASTGSQLADWFAENL